MDGAAAVEARKIRFALTCAVIFAIAVLFLHGLQRWSAVTGLALWLGVAGFVALRRSHSVAAGGSEPRRRHRGRPSTDEADP